MSAIGRMFARSVLPIMAAVLAPLPALANEAPAVAVHYEPSDTILILGAVPQEIPPFVNAMDNAERKSLWGIPYWEGEIGGQKAIVAITGIGKTYTIAARRGVVASSDLFGVTEERIANLRQNFNTDIMEMESAPLAHICVTLGVPCIVVRAGSNEAQEAPNDDYLRLGPIAARQAALFSLHLLTYLEEAGAKAP